MIFAFENEGHEGHGRRAPRLTAERDGSVERAAEGAGDFPGGVAADPSLRLETLGKLTDGFAHDFNNLLTIILGNLEQLQDHAQDAEFRRQVTMAHHAAKCGERMVKSLLSFARCQPGCRAIDINMVVRDMEPLLKHCLGSRIRVVMALDPDVHLVEADISRSEMALLNLTVNARDAMAGVGTLGIATANVVLSGDYEGLRGAFVALSVTDTGCGMPPEVLARAGEPFFTTKPAGRGTGLGLSMIRRFVKQAGGAVKLESECGKGTAVTIYLPCSPLPLVEPDIV
jgi:signal transduction histidine kinase